MALDNIFKNLEQLTNSGNENAYIASILDIFKKKEPTNDGQDNLLKYQHLKSFLQSIIHEIDLLGKEIENNQVLVSVKNQKTLRMCFEIISSFGISSCLIPGLGINLSKRCLSAQILPEILLSDEQKYEVLVICTDFLHRSYNVPVLKSIIIANHFYDYLAALIQLAFAPLKKPGVYPKFTMTEEMYEKLNNDRKKYIQIYESLVNHCFQPTLMKELLVLQSVTDPSPPIFVKKVLSKEMSRRLIAPGGLLSLIRCFLETHNIDTGIEWKKIDTICKIISSVHGNLNENDYIENMVKQLKQILLLNNAQYIATATSCVWSLLEKFVTNDTLNHFADEVFRPFDYNSLLIKSSLPGTIIMTCQEIERHLQILHACSSMTNLDLPSNIKKSNLYLLFLMRIKSTKDATKSRITDVILRSLECLNGDEITCVVEDFLFGRINNAQLDLLIEEYDAGLIIKCSSTPTEHQSNDALLNFLDIFVLVSNTTLVKNLFETCLKIFINISNERQKSKNNEVLIESELVSSDDEKYATMLNILVEISESPKVVNSLKAEPSIVINFVENLFMNNIEDSNGECKTIALILLNTVLSNCPTTNNIEEKLHKLVPILENLTRDKDEYVHILSKETITLILSEYPKLQDSAYEKALSNVFDKLLPVRAHGIMELTKLIDKNDAETISKRHYVFCLLKEQLKDSDSYVYLAAINGIASLATHCTSEVLGVLCKEYLELSLDKTFDTVENQNKVAEVRMKIGDIIVKVTKRLGEMAVVHKTTLLNTMLCACKDDDPLIRSSALSNLAEIALVLNYKIGTIIYEVLLCIWSIIETDKAIECRRAAVMVITSLIKGLGDETLMQLKENLLPVYRTLNKLYKDSNEDPVVKLHAQLAVEELDDIVKEFLTPKLPIEKNISIMNHNNDIVFK